MKPSKLFLAAALLVSSVWLTSCLTGGNSQSYSNAYGYVGESSGVLYVNTSGGYSMTWSTISSSGLEAGDCIQLSYSMDYSTLNGFYAAQNVSYGGTPLTAFTLNSSDPIDVNDSNFVSAIYIQQYAPTVWYGDNWFITFATKTYTGVAVTPKFYYSTTIKDGFNVENDSVIVDVRLKVTGTATSTTTSTTSNTYAVDLTPIRSLYSAYSGESIPIYFRYYASASTPTYLKTAMTISE